MTENTENLVIEILRKLQGETADMRTEMRERLDRLEVRLGFIEQALCRPMSCGVSRH